MNTTFEILDALNEEMDGSPYPMDGALIFEDENSMKVYSAPRVHRSSRDLPEL